MDLNPFKWLRNKKARERFSGLLGDQGRFYYLLDYRDTYKVIAPDERLSDEVLSELFLFRFWLTQYALRLCKPDSMSEDEILDDVISNGVTLGKGMFERMNHLNIARALGDSAEDLLQSRFEEYDEAVITAKDSDPLGLGGASKILANRVSPSPFPLSMFLTSLALIQFKEIADQASGASTSSPSLPNEPSRPTVPPRAAPTPEKPTSPPQSATRKLTPPPKRTDVPASWSSLNKFGESETFVDEDSIAQAGVLVEADVIYLLNPHGTDKRNNRPVKKLVMREEYDLARSVFRVQRIDFFYADGPDSSALDSLGKWASATEGNAKTLQALKLLTRG